MTRNTSSEEQAFLESLNKKLWRLEPFRKNLAGLGFGGES
jgi:hypothetical protein